MQGTIQLKTDRLLLRKHIIEDAEVLYSRFGLDEEMHKYSGWNPYATDVKALKTVEYFMDSYEDCTFYGWAIVLGDELIGTIGAYDYNEAESSIEIGISIARDHWSHGYGSEALICVLQYLTKEEKIQSVTAWCAVENIGSKRIMEKVGMVLVNIEQGTLCIDGKQYDKWNYTYSEG